MNVFILHHVHELTDDYEDVKLLGVYATAEDAEAARRRLESQPGFRENPEGFSIDEYTIGEDLWTEGFVTVTYPVDGGDHPAG